MPIGPLLQLLRWRCDTAAHMTACNTRALPAAPDKGSSVLVTGGWVTHYSGLVLQRLRCKKLSYIFCTRGCAIYVAGKSKH